MSKDNNNHTVAKAVAATAVTVTGAYATASYAIFNRIFRLDEDSSLFRDSSASYQDETSNEWFLSSRRHDDFIVSFDGLDLHAIRIENHPESNKWVIIEHPYRSSALNMKKLAYEFDKRGYNVFIPDQRGSGLSKGKYTSLGWTEHYDLINWINLVVNKYPNSEIVLYGSSTGANAIMHCSGDFVPKNIKCGVIDTGFVSQESIISKFIERKTNVNGDIFLFGINFFVKQILHFSLQDANAIHQLENAHFPMLFIHDKGNEYISDREAYNAFYACSSKKDIYFYQRSIDSNESLNKVFNFVETL